MINRSTFLIALLLLSFVLNVSSQTTLTTSNDTTICLGGSATLSATVTSGSYGTNSYSFQTYGYSPEPFAGGTAVCASFTNCSATSGGKDDCVSGPFPIGFSFCFFNHTYTQFWIGSNGWISFSAPPGTNWDTFTATPIPNPASSVPKNAIFFPWEDWLPCKGMSQNVFYYTEGTAPNRKLVVYFGSTTFFNCNGSQFATFQAVLNEQTSVIENHIQSKPLCNNEGATQGVQDSTGTIAFTATGRNDTPWSASNESTRFVPSGITWYTGGYPGGTIVGYGTPITFSPTVTTTYTAEVQECNGDTATGSVTVTVVNAQFNYPLATYCQSAPNPIPNIAVPGGTFTAVPAGLVFVNANTGVINLGASAPGTYTITYTITSPCTVFTSQGMTIVGTPPPPTPLATYVSRCGPGQVTFGVVQPTGETIHWYDAPTGGNLLFTGASVTTNVATTTHYYAEAVTNATNCASLSRTNIIVVIYPIPVINNAVLNYLVCSGDSTNIILSSTVPSSTFQWTASSSAVTLTGYSGGSGPRIKQKLTNSGAVNDTVIYTVIATADTCSSSAVNFVVAVKPLFDLTATPLTQTICSNNPITINLSSTNLSTTFSWIAIGNNPGLSGYANGSGNPISQTLLNSGPGDGTVTYKIVPHGAGCTGDTAISTVLVHQQTVPTITGPAAICSGITGSVYSTETAMTNYQWVVSPGGSITAGGTATDNTVTVNWNTLGAQTVTVNYHDGNGCTALNSTIYPVTINPLPTATISGTIAVCQNSASPLITFTGSSATAPYTFTYNINGGANQQVTTTIGNSVNVAAPTNVTGTFTYNLISVQDASSTTCSQLQPGSAIVTVNALPTATITGTTSVCQNTAAPLITFTGGNTTPPYTFTYNINGGANLQVTTTIGNNVTVAAPTGVVGIFTYNLISVQDGSATTCSQLQAGSAIVTVNPLPTATISGTIAVCQNAASPLVTFTGSSSTPPYTFTYNINGGANQQVTTTVGNSVTVAAPTNVTGTFTYNLISVQDASTTTCSQPQAGSAIITITLLPTATISGTTVVCKNAASPLITFTGGTTTPPYTFTYNINGGANQQVTTTVGNSVSVAAPTGVVGIFNYSLISVQDGSATTCSQLQAGSAVVTVNPLPTAIITGSTAVCQNAASPLITFTGASSIAPYTFTYNINGGANLQVTTTVGNSVSVAAPTNVVGTFTYNLIGVQDGSATTCSQLQAGSAVVTVNPLPTATISGTISVCKNSPSPLITFTGSSATAPYTFTYIINGGANQQVTTTVGNSVTVAAPTNVTGTFTYNLISVQDGSMTSCAQPQAGSAIITVNPLPTAMITGSTAVCQNSASPLITFTGGTTTPPYTFTYNINGGANLQVTTTVGNSVTVAAPTGVVGLFTYNLISVLDGSATTCSQLQAGSAVVTVNPLPTATISGTTAVCQNSASPLITFTGSSSTPPYTFTYNINGGANQQVTTTVGNSVTVAAPTNITGIFTYNLISVQDASFTTCSQLQSGSAIVTVNPLPTATITGTTAVCQNSTAPMITFTGSSASAPYTFTYNINGGANQQVTTTVGNSVSVAAPTGVVGIFNYNLISVQDGSATTCSQLQAGSAVVTVNPLPTAIITGSTAVCQNAASPLITFTGASSIAPYTFTYNINGGANLQVTTTVGNSVTVAAPTNIVGLFTYNLISVKDGSATTCSQLQSGSAVVTVNPLPTATISGTIAVCQNAASPLITFTGSSATAPYTFTYNINGGANQQVTTTVGNSVTVAASTAVVGTFTYNLISVHDGSFTTCSQLQSGSAIVTVNTLPTATITGSTAVCQNSASPLITFTGNSSMAPYTFTYNINGGANLQVTTTIGNSVTVTAPTGVVGLFTYNLVSVQDGSATACSQLQGGSAVVTINPLPTAIISGTTAVCLNSASPLITFTGSSATAPYTFTYNINGGANQQVTTTVGNSVMIAAPTNVAGVFTYNLISVKDASFTTCSQLQSGSAIVTVNPLPTATITGTTAVCQNSTAPLITFTGNSASAPYTFTYNINGGTNQQVTTTVGNSVTVAAPTGVVGIFAYNLISIQDGSFTSCSQTQAGSAIVTVNPLPTATISGSTAVCQNAPSPLITFTGASSTAPYTFTYNINGGANLQVSTTVGNSVTVSAPTNTSGIFTYNLISVKDASATLCSQLQPGSATITINSLPVPLLSGPTSVCINSSSTYSTDPGMTNYSWNVLSNGTITGGSGTNSITVLWNSGGTSTIQVNYINGNGCTAASPSSSVITINNLPTPHFLTGLTSLCSGLSSVYTTEAGMNNYAWSVSAGGTITAGGGTSDNTATVLWNTSGAQAISVNYVVGPGCTSPLPSSENITVKPRPLITNAANSSVCSNGTTNIVPIANLAGSTFSWVASGSSGNVSGFNSGAGFSINDNLVNTGFNTETVTYVVTPSLNGCDGTPANYIVTVYPVADVYFTPNGQTFCSGGTTSISLLSHVTGTNFTWTATGSSGNVSGFSPGSGAMIAQTLTNSGTSTETVNYTISSSANSCPGLNTNVTITIYPVPSMVYSPCTDITTTTDAVPFTLKGGTPLGGIYTGAGVNSGIFYPTLAGTGAQTINYSYTNTYGCTSSASLIISVLSAQGFTCNNMMMDVRDNTQYPTVQLGTQCWLASNLNYGSTILSSTMQIDNCVVEKYCFNDNAANCSSTGGLYQWDKMMQFNDVEGVQGLCPPAWHIPTENEWTTLFNYYTSNGFAGSPLKSSGFSGFNALLTGIHFDDVIWSFGNFSTYFWSSTSQGPTKAWAHSMNVPNPSVSYYPGNRSNAFSVRCIKN